MHFSNSIPLATLLLLTLGTATPVPGELSSKAVALRRNVATEPIVAPVRAAYQKRYARAKSVTVAHSSAQKTKRQEVGNPRIGYVPADEVDNNPIQKFRRQDDDQETYVPPMMHYNPPIKKTKRQEIGNPSIGYVPADEVDNHPIQKNKRQGSDVDLGVVEVSDSDSNKRKTKRQDDGSAHHGIGDAPDSSPGSDSASSDGGSKKQKLRRQPQDVDSSSSPPGSDSGDSGDGGVKVRHHPQGTGDSGSGDEATESDNFGTDGDKKVRRHPQDGGDDGTGVDGSGKDGSNSGAGGSGGSLPLKNRV